MFNILRRKFTRVFTLYRWCNVIANISQYINFLPSPSKAPKCWCCFRHFVLIIYKPHSNYARDILLLLLYDIRGIKLLTLRPQLVSGRIFPTQVHLIPNSQDPCSFYHILLQVERTLVLRLGNLGMNLSWAI